MSKARGFEEVKDEAKEYKQVANVFGKEQTFYPETNLPVRADLGSAGYDFYTPINIQIQPNQTVTIWTNVKAYMQENEVLFIFIRSSLGIKEGITLANGTGVIDASYYGNSKNDGNIGLCLRNNTGQTKFFQAGERIAQGVFLPFLVADEDVVLKDKRDGGIGSSN